MCSSVWPPLIFFIIIIYLKEKKKRKKTFLLSEGQLTPKCWQVAQAQIFVSCTASHAQLMEQVIFKIFWKPGVAGKNIQFCLLRNPYCYKLAMQNLSQVLKLPVMVTLLS